MKNISFYIIILALVCVAGYLGKIALDQSRLVSEYQKSRQQIASQIQTEAKQISKKVDEKGIETVLFDVTQNRANVQGDNDLKESTKGIIDTTALALDIRDKQLKEILIVKSSLEAENLRLKKQLDANERPYYTYTGNGLNLKFTPPNEIDTIGRADFQANVNIKATQYWKKNWFLGSKRSILAITSDNPNFKINGADFVEFEQKQPTLGMRVQGQFNIDPATLDYGVGPGLRIDIGRLSLQGGYLRYPSLKKWKYNVGANYDFVRF